MKKILLITAAIIMTMASLTAAPSKGPKVTRVEPPMWWTGMVQDTLQLMLTGPDIGSADVTLNPYEGVRLLETVRLESPNYLLIYLDITDSAKPGRLDFTLTEGKHKTTLGYDLLARRQNPDSLNGFDASDVLYLIMPDRFARGHESAEAARAVKALNHNVATDRANPNARHGGNIAGMRDRLGYLDSLGITAIWVNPVLVNDMPGGSYHGYATTDYYAIDPRFGTNEEWREFVDDCHKRGIKVVMDMIFNHCGVAHPWLSDLPSRDWLNHPDGDVMTSFRLSTVHDPYASDYDLDRTVNGWFVPSMPDINQRNPHVMKYLSQNSIWWIESSGINGIRMDTYPYADERAMAGWIDDVMREYPGFNIVGECWYANEAGPSTWQRDSRVNPHGDPRLPTVMDFALMLGARDAFSSQTDRLGGLNKIYDHLSLDYLYPDPSHILTFLDNHDTDRILLSRPDSLGWWKQAVTFLLTSRGIPQIYYGTEILMNGTKEVSDGFVRCDFPGGFPGDSRDAFTRTGRTEQENEAWDFMSQLLNWRRGNEVIARGTLKHFMPENGLYVYQRRLGDKEVTVMMNGNDTPLTASMDNIREILPEGARRRDMLSGQTFEITREMTFPARAILILEN